jgi:hypothetical protein
MFVVTEGKKQDASAPKFGTEAEEGRMTVLTRSEEGSTGQAFPHGW